MRSLPLSPGASPPPSMFDSSRSSPAQFLSTRHVSVSVVACALLLAQRDVKEHGKLNFHLYLALKKALYKPSAFFKGLLLPLCEGRCSLREALIVSSVLQKVSVPMLHSAVAILKLAEANPGLHLVMDQVSACMHA